MMTVFVESTGLLSLGNFRGAVGALTLDSSYPHGGYPVTPEELSSSHVQFGFGEIPPIVITQSVVGSGGEYQPYYDVEEQTLRLFSIEDGSEVSNGTNVSDVNLWYIVLGR